MKALFIMLFSLNGTFVKIPTEPASLELLGTRSWIRVEWKDDAVNEKGFKIYWSENAEKPDVPGAIVEQNKTRYYIQRVKEETNYYIWVESYNESGTSKAITGNVTTIKKWVRDSSEAKELTVASSAAVPEGMELFWHDEFNDELLNRNKWFTSYYSTIDYHRKENADALKNNSLPEAAYKLNGEYIDLFVNDKLPVRAFSDGKKISSIQTYSWSTNENLLDNSRGGYFEVRVRRGSTGKPRGLNTAFWFDSPGPDLKYYLQEGTEVDGTKGIRPAGQLFEIDVFEYLNAQFVMHGKVDSNGRFLRNLATNIAEDYQPHKHVPGAQWVTFGLLWTPSGIKHYIDGKLIKAYEDKHQIYSPNHFMNVFLGSYGAGGTVNMEVDYIRYYRWPISNENELPNGGAECSNNIYPWEGDASIFKSEKRSGVNSFLLAPGQSLEQYIYLNNSKAYNLQFWSKGAGNLEVQVSNIKQVVGATENVVSSSFAGTSSFSKNELAFETGAEYGEHMKTVKVSFKNSSNENVIIDDIKLYRHN